VHKASVVACALVSAGAGPARKEVRTFGTTTDEVVALADWLAGLGVTRVALEATGVYWQPIWNLLEDRFALLLVNVRHVKAVPGRKTDVKDAVPVPGSPLADLVRHGLLTGSFVPDREQRELRELTRYRTTLLRERAAEANRLQKTLEGANLKIASVITDVTGKSGRAILRALVGGETDPARLAELAEGRLREKLPALRQALVGRFGAHQRFLVAQQLDHLEFLDGRIDQVGNEIAARTRPAAEAIARLDAIPGVGQRTAEILVAEVGTDLGRFPTADHLASWAGCPLGDVPRQPPERRPASERKNPEGEPVAAGGVGRGRAGGRAHQGLVPAGAVPALGGPARQAAGHRRRRPHDPADRRPPAPRPDERLRGAGSRRP
jgi:transposase